MSRTCKWLVLTAALITTTVSAETAVRIGTSSVGSLYYILAVGASEVIRKNSDVNATVEPVGGSAANVIGLGAKKVDFATANSYASYTGYHGLDRFKEPVDIRLVVQGSPTMRWMVVRTGSGIESPRDLVGKTVVARRRALPEIKLIMDAFIEHFDLPADRINMVTTSNTNEAIDALRAGSVDAAILPLSSRAPQVEKPMSDGVMTLMAISEADRDAMLELLPKNFFGETEPANSFSNQPQAVPWIAMNTYFITRADLPDDTVYEVAKALFDHNDQLVTYHKRARSWTAERAVRNVALPFHPGVIRYFEEKGLWTPELAASQQELLKR